MTYFFQKSKFIKELASYRSRPSRLGLGNLTKTYLEPLCRKYASSKYVTFHDDDEREDAIQIATKRCVDKLDRFTIGAGSPLAFFDRIAQRSMIEYASREHARRQKMTSLDECTSANHERTRHEMIAAPSALKYGGECDKLLETSLHAAVVLALLWDFKPRQLPMVLGLGVNRAERLISDIAKRLMA